jgi:mRNA-degrading endonuclease toxin of MazEF toxin-antitoxin module
VKVGDLYWVEFPGGAVRAHPGRPALLVQLIEANDRLPTALVLPLTAQPDALRFPGTVLIEPTPENGLCYLSVALVFQLTALDRRFLGLRLGTVSAEVMAAVWSAFDDLTERTKPE